MTYNVDFSTFLRSTEVATFFHLVSMQLEFFQCFAGEEF